MLGVVVSRADRASEHVGEHLLDLAEWTRHEDDGRPEAAGGGDVYRADGVELREFEELHLHLDGVSEAFGDVDLLVFASRHSGETGPLLTAHHTGNFGPADHGGSDDALARACPYAHDRVLDALAEHAPEGYEVGTECTHHGPSAVGVPSMFVEVGSAEPQWEDPEAARAVARAILDLRGVAPDRPAEGDAPAADRERPTRRHLVGFGGGHYAPRFERIVRGTDWSVGHVAADWGLDAMGDPAEKRAVVAAAFEESAAEVAVVEGEYPRLVETVEDLGYRVVGESWVQAVDGVPLGLVERMEAVLSPVAEGLRFGDPAAEVDPGGAFETVDLPDELLAEAQGVDREAVRAVVADVAVAFETTDNGSRVAGRAAIASAGDYDRLVERVVPVLREKYEEVRRDGDEVIARQETFDPEKAATLGVPEGPAYGRLASGDSVEVDGRTIPPAEVRSEEVRRFSL